MGQDEIHELIAAYALNALDEREEAEYEAHLAHCPACRRELASFQEAATSLAYVVDAPAPASALRDRILREARSERQNVVPLRRPGWAFPIAATAAAVACIAVAVGIWAASLSSSLDEERAARSAQERALAVAAQPDSERFELQGANGTLIVAPTGEAALVVTGLDPAPEGKLYEAWVITDGERVLPAGTFEAGDERTVVPLRRPVPEGGLVAVTVEEEEVDAPTSEPIFSAQTA